MLLKLVDVNTNAPKTQSISSLDACKKFLDVLSVIVFLLSTFQNTEVIFMRHSTKGLKQCSKENIKQKHDTQMLYVKMMQQIAKIVW